LAQVLGNLITNALRYVPPKGEIVVSAARHQDGVELRVQDNGPGISEKDLPRIFDRFYRGDESRHTESGESGLGLAIAKSIVEAHHGSMSVESVPGKGTTFILVLPAAPSA
jgi:signal transduction histidine kinase